ncbi:MAG: BCCT family transporter [Proteobacteria bacterium]|nr:BCCT family transporter [Pseudomonadota bacterium]MDA1037920.1 BCCT family transporter [Pseudomonadota bacterium]
MGNIIRSAGCCQLKAGGLGALQTAVVIFGIPFSIITAFACRELLRSLREEIS